MCHLNYLNLDEKNLIKNEVYRNQNQYYRIQFYGPVNVNSIQFYFVRNDKIQYTVIQ